MNSPEHFDSQPPNHTPRAGDDVSESQNADFEDAMLDVLLAELLAGQSPPDQSRAIIRRLNEPVTVAASTRPVSSQTSTSSTTSSWSLALATAAVVLLGIGFGFRFRHDLGFASKPNLIQPSDNSKQAIAARSADDSTNGLVIHAPEKAPRETSNTGDTLPTRSIELAGGSADDLPSRNPLDMFRESPQTLPNQEQPKPPVAEPLTLVSTSLTNHLQRYWNRVGVQPTEMLPADMIASRLADKLHLKVPPSAIGDSQAMLNSLAQPNNTEALAVQILAAISSRRAESLTRQSDQTMIKQIAVTLRSGSGFDELLASWFVPVPEQPLPKATTTDNPNDSDSNSMASFGALLQPLGNHEAIVTTAAVTLGADLRCQRCHDIPHGNTRGLTTQHDYWQLAANISPWLNRNPNSPTGWFYDTLDGRRRLAQSNTNSNWSQALLGSRPLAEGLIGAMWKMVHGRPLESSPYDLAGSASDTDLRQLHNDLANDLIASDFNLLRTISLMLTDSIVGRSTPAAMTPTGLLTASNDDWMQAVSTIESFAAAPPDALPSSRGERMRLVQQSDLPRTGSADGAAAVLAQPLGTSESDTYDGSQPRKRSPIPQAKLSPAMLAGLPLRATIVMPAWIVELPDFDSRLVHIAHLAGLGDVPNEARELAGQMQEAGVEEALILQRIWWIIRPQG
jgi:hypothetical protein